MYHIVFLDEENYEQIPFLKSEAQNACLTGSNRVDSYMDSSFWKVFYDNVEVYHYNNLRGTFFQKENISSIELSEKALKELHCSLFGNFPYFWLIHDKEDAPYDISYLPTNFLCAPKKVNDINNLFEKIALNHKWALFSWGDGNGCFCLGFITKNKRLLDEFLSFSQDQNFQIAFTVKTVDDNSSFQENISGVLFDDPERFVLNDYLWDLFRKKGNPIVAWVNDTEGILAPDGSGRMFNSTGLRRIGTVNGEFWGWGPQGIYEVFDKNKFFELLNFGIRRGHQLLCFSGHTEMRLIEEMITNCLIGSFICDFQYLNQIEWLFSSGRNNADLRHYAFSSDNPEMIENLLSLLEDINNTAKLISCF